MTSEKTATRAAGAGTLRGELTTPKITVMVVAAAAPMSCVAGIIPLSFAIGSGAATPVVYLVAGVVLLLFAVGYAAIAGRMSSAGGFYQYIAKGLGRPPAVAAAFVAIIAYNAVALTCVAGIGYFGSYLVDERFGWSVNWSVFSVLAIAVVGFLGYRQIDLAAKVLVYLLAVEVAIVVILDVAIVLDRGLDAFPLSILQPSTVLDTGSIGLGLMFALLSFIGFESAALYGEESKDPRRTVPRATFLSVVVISLFYFVSSWIAVGAIGPDQVQSVASEQLVATFFNLSDTFASSALTRVMEIAYLTSMLAALLALHNAANRYLFVAGRERLLPRWVGKAHPEHQTPARASLVHTVAALVVVAVAVAGGLDPYLDVVTSMTGLGTLGVVLLQLAASAAIGAYFVRRREGMVGTIAATAVAFVALSVLVVMILRNFSTLSGASTPVIDALPWVLVGLAFVGAGYGRWLKANRPATYAGIAADPEGEHL
ncbi:APC family permease [Nocardioides sp. WV_118_6]